ncbi:ABC transporter ATP-binding protein [Acholeplasma granularum]|uniref:ABC transporter ATP-binding protein/permease n=1 Tax=Acholeplasma granularum TaxID=264635 RepID=UPI0004B2D20A|nr:ABC transporter ATP-binding protein [Acholeplasma granularum]
MPLIKLDNISKFYKSGEGVSVGMQKVSLEFNYGEFIAITGESGSGKSTLLNVISGLDTYEDGELYINDEETSHFIVKDWENYRSKYIGFIFQSYNIIDSYTVYENVMLALEVQNYPRKLRKKRALELIEKVGLLSHKNHKASKLSGGQKQRTVIARALAKDCPIIVADEPTGNLDSESSKQVINLLREISKDKLVIIVTHDYDQVKDIATRKIKMHDGQIVEDKLIKETRLVDKKIEPKIEPMTLPTVMKFALRNLLSKPKLLIFFTALQVMIILVFTITYSNVMHSARNINIGFDLGLSFSQPYYDFNKNYMSDNRMNILRKDGKDFTTADYEYLSNLNGGDHYIYKDVISIDSEIVYNISYESNGRYYYPSGIKFDTSYHIEHNPQFLIDGSFNIENMNQVIVSNAFDIQVGEHVSMYHQAYVTMVFDSIHEGNYIYTITGNNKEYFDSYTYDVYFLDESVFTIPNYFDGTIDLTNFIATDKLPMIDYVKITTTEWKGEDRLYEVVGIYNDANRNVIYFSHDDLIPTTSSSNTFSLSASNNVTAKRLFNSIDKSEYRVIFPNEEADIVKKILAPLYFLFSLLFYSFIYLFALFLYFILYSVMKNVMNSRKKDFAIFRSIGTNEGKLGLLVIFEQLYMVLIAFIIAMITLNIISYYDYSMNVILEQITIIDYIVLLLTFTYLSFWLARRFNKKTFRISIIENLTESREETI